MESTELTQLLQRVLAGELSIESAVARLTAGPLPPAAAPGRDPRTAATLDAQVDINRRERCGFPEVVFAAGKTSQAVVDIFAAQIRHGQDCLATRVTAEQAAAVLEVFPQARHNPLARTVRLNRDEQAPSLGRVAVITAGTSDRPVAEEALETLKWMHTKSELIVDVGVAGPHRLPEHYQRFAHADAVVVVAGMEGALPSVVAGWVDRPVIAVPTSVGYGSSFGGLTALLGMLNSCASNVAVVNIDAGFKGGYLAGLIARRTAASADPA